jgi:hypothetical protein
LARELGLIGSDPETTARIRRENQERWRRERPKREFERWRDRAMRTLSEEHRQLAQKAELAHRVLLQYPEEPHAWNALKEFADKEAKIMRALDFLTYQRASRWLERDSTEAEVFAAWKEDHRHATR